jgi:hypothetical protein
MDQNRIERHEVADPKLGRLDGHVAPPCARRQVPAHRSSRERGAVGSAEWPDREGSLVTNLARIGSR